MKPARKNIRDIITLLALMLFFCLGVGWYMLIEKVNELDEERSTDAYHMHLSQSWNAIHTDFDISPRNANASIESDNLSIENENASIQNTNSKIKDWFALPEDWNPPNYESTKAVFDVYFQSELLPKTHIQNIMNHSIVYLTYGERCCEQAVKRGCTSFLSIANNMNHQRALCLPFTQKNVETRFLIQHKKHFTKQTVGAGYWLWKPYLIHRILHDDHIMQEGDYLFYSDAGAFLVGPIHPLLLYMHLTNASYLFFQTPHKQAVHCKRDSFVRQRCDAPECHDAIQVSTAYSVWRKDAESKRVAQEWLEDAKDYQSISDEPNIHGLKNLYGFKHHRHDKCILTNVLTRKGRRGGVDPSLAFMVVHDGSKL